MKSLQFAFLSLFPSKQKNHNQNRTSFGVVGRRKKFNVNYQGEVFFFFKVFINLKSRVTEKWEREKDRYLPSADLLPRGPQ